MHPAVESLLTDREEGEVFTGSITLRGGLSAISQDVEDELVFNSPGNTVTRQAGSTRHETSVVLAEAFQNRSGSAASIGLVNGFAADGWVYALTAGAIAPVTDAPVLYVQADAIPAGPLELLSATQPTTILTFGPAERISDKTVATARQAAGR